MKQDDNTFVSYIKIPDWDETGRLYLCLIYQDSWLRWNRTTIPLSHISRFLTEMKQDEYTFVSYIKIPDWDETGRVYRCLIYQDSWLRWNRTSIPLSHISRFLTEMKQDEYTFVSYIKIPDWGEKGRVYLCRISIVHLCTLSRTAYLSASQTWSFSRITRCLGIRYAHGLMFRWIVLA